MSNQNDTHPADPGDPTDLETRIAGELRELLAVEQREHDRLEAELTAVRARRDRYRRALGQLTGDSPKLGKPAKSPAPASQYDWQITDAKIASIWQLVRHRTDRFAASQVARDTPGLSPESAKRALDRLREHEFVRVVGRGRGGGTLLAVMPGAADREYPNGA